MRRAVAASALLLAVLIAALALPATARADHRLRNGGVTPTTGTTQVAFEFRVEYTGNTVVVIPEVWAEVAGLRVDMEPQPSADPLADSLTYVGRTSLPVGDWPVTFFANAVGESTDSLAGPVVAVRAPATPTPRPTPPPTPTPTPTPTATVVPTPTPTPSPTPTPTSTPSPDPTPGGGVFTPSPTPTEQPQPAASVAPAATERSSGALDVLPLAILFLGGTVAGSGAAMLAVHWQAGRRAPA